MPEFDVLDALSRARTALDDPQGLDLTIEDAAAGTRYAIDRIDEVIGALRFEPANDARGEARWVLMHIGRLLAAAGDAIEAELSRDPELLDDLRRAGDAIDNAYDSLTSERERDAIEVGGPDA